MDKLKKGTPSENHSQRRNIKPIKSLPESTKSIFEEKQDGYFKRQIDQLRKKKDDQKSDYVDKISDLIYPSRNGLTQAFKRKNTQDYPDYKVDKNSYDKINNFSIKLKNGHIHNNKYLENMRK